MKVMMHVFIWFFRGEALLITFSTAAPPWLFSANTL